MKYLFYLSLVLLFASCGVRTLEGRAWPVYFSAEDVVFSDSLDPKPSLYYHGPSGFEYPCQNLVELEPGQQAKALITRPTIFTMKDKTFLVNPKDRIRVTVDPSQDFAPSLSTQNKKKTRDRELLVLKSFLDQEHAPKVVRLIDYDYQTILNLESALKEQIEPAELASQLLFDSLSNVFQVSRKFKRSTKDFVRNRYDGNVLDLYWLYRDTLFARAAYYDKVRAYLPAVNNLDARKRLNSNMVGYINFLNASLYPSLGVRNMVYNGRFDAAFDTISTTFKGPARDLLLSRLIQHAYKSGYSIPSNIEKEYRRYSINNDLRKVLARTKRAYDTVQLLHPLLPNDLILADGQSTTRWENVVEQNKGKYILVDFWASWCVPCLEDQPALEALKQLYTADKITFLSLSMDKNLLAWKSQMNKLNSDSTTNFLLVHTADAAIVKSLKVNTIPRYMLINPAGNFIDVDAPGPQDPELKVKLDKLMAK